jgi:putative DNA primase/helicase
MTARKRLPTLPPAVLLRIDPAAPFDTARLFLFEEFYTNGHPTLHHHRGAFYAWNDAAYREISRDDVRGKLYAFLDRCTTGTGTGGKVKPNTALVNNVLDALTARAQLDTTISAPAWLDGGSSTPPEEIIACSNGLLHLPTLQLLPLTPSFYTHNAIDFGFDVEAPAPVRWLKFLDELWPADVEAIATLQEIFGYCLTSDTSQQKAFLIVGPPRSGKGTIARALERLVGIDNKVNPTLAELGRNFGIAPLIGKRVAIVSDARLGQGVGQHIIAERLLSITGEDAITVDRKYLSAWTGRLQVRFLILSNELPRFTDASGALARRFILLKLTNSFYGKEDRGLLNRLLRELPAILNWAIDGWRRLNGRGYFEMPKSSADAVEQLEDLGSPVGAFVRERCVVAPGRTVEVAMLFAMWSDWCEMQNRNPGTEAQFGKDLHAAVPGIKVMQPRTATGRPGSMTGSDSNRPRRNEPGLARAGTRSIFYREIKTRKRERETLLRRACHRVPRGVRSDRAAGARGPPASPATRAPGSGARWSQDTRRSASRASECRRPERPTEVCKGWVKGPSPERLATTGLRRKRTLRSFECRADLLGCLLHILRYRR